MSKDRYSLYLEEELVESAKERYDDLSASAAVNRVIRESLNDDGGTGTSDGGAVKEELESVKEVVYELEAEVERQKEVINDMKRM